MMPCLLSQTPFQLSGYLGYLGKINSKIRLPLVTLDEKYHQKLITAYEATLWEKLIGLPILALILCSCSFKPLTDKFNEVTAPDYVNSSKAEKLQLPPDLSEYETSDTYNVPGAATSYTDFENQRNRKIEKVELLKDPDGIKLVKSGNFRWLVVNKSPDKIWPHLEDFWYEQGFNMKKMNRRLGVMETEWTPPKYWEN